MSTDLEQRLRDELRGRARDAGPSRTSGGAVRHTAAVRRGRRLRAGAVAGTAALVTALVAGAVITAGGGSPDDLPALPTSTPTSSPTGSSTTSEDVVRVQVPPAQLERAYALMSAGRPPLLAAAALPRSGDTVLVFQQGIADRTVVRTVTLHDGKPLLGTLAFARSWDQLVAQPARDGAGATLVVVVPLGSHADSVEVTTSIPGKDIRTGRVDLDGRLAMVPIDPGASVTRLVQLHGGSVVEDRIPGDFHLSPSVPRPLARVVVSAGTTQLVQVRTDGVTACRLTTNELESPDVVVMEWNPFDEACARIDPSGLRLLIAADRRYSSVAGVAPTGSVDVRLHWQNGDVTNTPVAVDEVPAFVDTSGRRPDRLVLAEALGADGTVLAQARP
jgi:hypothetical protein